MKTKRERKKQENAQLPSPSISEKKENKKTENRKKKTYRSMIIIYCSAGISPACTDAASS